MVQGKAGVELLLTIFAHINVWMHCCTVDFTAGVVRRIMARYFGWQTYKISYPSVCTVSISPLAENVTWDFVLQHGGMLGWEPLGSSNSASGRRPTRFPALVSCCNELLVFCRSSSGSRPWFKWQLARTPLLAPRKQERLLRGEEGSGGTRSFRERWVRWFVRSVKLQFRHLSANTHLN